MAPSILQACDLRPDESDRGKLHHSLYVYFCWVMWADLAVANHVHAHRYVIFYLLSVFPSHLRLLNGQAKVALYTVVMLQPCSAVCGEVPTGHTYIQTIGTRHVNSTYSKRITSHIPTSLLVGSLPLAHNAEHFTSNIKLCTLQWML